MHIFITYIPVFFFEIYGFLFFANMEIWLICPNSFKYLFYSETIGTKSKVDRTVH
jgi:hypothetical protein